MIDVKPISWNIDKGLVAPEWQWAWPSGAVWWLMSEGGGLTTRGDGKSGHDGTLVSAVTWVTSEVGRVLNFAGGDDYIDCGTQVVSAYPYTLVALCKPTSGNDSVVVHMGDISASNVYTHLRWVDGGPQWNFTRRNAASGNAEGGSLSGGFQLVIGVGSSPTSGELYVDGVSVGTNSSSINWNSNTDTTRIGVLHRNTTDTILDMVGPIAYAGILPFAMTGGQVRQLNANRFGPFLMARRLFGKVAAVGARPQGPLGHPLHGPLAGPIAA